MESIWQTVQLAVWNIGHRMSFQVVVDIAIVAFLIYEFMMMIRQTRASSVIVGMITVLAVAGLSTVFGLTALNWLVMGLVNYGVVVLIVLFQPELRKALEQIGRFWRFGRQEDVAEGERERIVDEITQCMLNLSRRRVGALIVLEGRTGVQDLTDQGTALDARITAGLLINIFEPNTPLHDGAVIIRGGRILAAACVLPLTESENVSRELGTRHRAAMGVTETTDAVSLIVSEETGIMSYARNGKITRHLTEDSLRQLLQGLFGGPNDDLRVLIRREMKRIRSLGKGVRGHE